MFFDTHAHYDDGRFDPDRAAVLAELPAAGVGLVVNAGTDLPTSRFGLELAEDYPFVYAAVGIHPHEADSLDEAALDQLKALSGHEKAVAIGEIGLDYHYDFSPREQQKKAFRAQMALARELDLPVIVHDRDAHGDCLAIVSEYPDLRGVFHCFSGSPEMAQTLLDRGWYLGFDGPVTYKNAKRAPEVIALCPMERILLETDSPYLAPVPHRGKRNDSRNLPWIAAKIGEVKGCSPETVARTAMENGKRLFRIP